MKRKKTFGLSFSKLNRFRAAKSPKSTGKTLAPVTAASRTLRFASQMPESDAEPQTASGLSFSPRAEGAPTPKCPRFSPGPENALDSRRPGEVLLVSRFSPPTASEVMEVGSSWSDLLEEVLNAILVRLSLADAVNFGRVCRSWRSVMAERRALSRPPPLLAMLIEQPHYGRSVHQTYKLSFFNGQLHKLKQELRPVVLAVSSFFRPCFGNSYGFLLVKSFPAHKFLLNPISGERIDLPAFYGDVKCAALSSSPSSSDCMVIVNAAFHCNDWGDGGSLASWKMGDTEWTRFAQLKKKPLCMSFHKGELYVREKDGNTRVYASKDGKMTLTASVDDWILEANTSARGKPYMVETGEELFLVTKVNSVSVVMSTGGDTWRLDRKQFWVFRTEGKRWVRVTNLGHRALYVAPMASACFDTREVMGSDLRANCVYFVDSSASSLSMYSMEDQSLQKSSLGQCGWPNDPTMWLAPNEWHELDAMG